MADTNDVDREKSRLEEEIASLRLTTQQYQDEYQKELQSLREDLGKQIRGLGSDINAKHAEELRRISTCFDEASRKLAELVDQYNSELRKKLEHDNKKLDDEIGRLQGAINSQRAESKRIADEYCQKVEKQWGDLRKKDHLQSYINPDKAIYETTMSNARKIYELKQYQAVTGIMVNLGSSILAWEQSAELLRAEWQGLYDLCKELIEYIGAALKEAYHQHISCDGNDHSADLHIYNQNGFANAESVMAAEKTKFKDCEALTNAEMRIFLQDLRKEQILVDELIKHCLILHCAHVRRFRVARFLSSWLMKRSMKLINGKGVENDPLKGYRLIYRDVYQRDLFSVTLTSVPDHSQTIVDMIYLPANVMDETLEKHICSTISQSATEALGKNGLAGITNSQVNMYRNGNGMYQATVEVHHSNSTKSLEGNL